MDTCNKLGEFTITGVERARKGEPKVGGRARWMTGVLFAHCFRYRLPLSRSCRAAPTRLEESHSHRHLDTPSRSALGNYSGGVTLLRAVSARSIPRTFGRAARHRRGVGQNRTVAASYRPECLTWTGPAPRPGRPRCVPAASPLSEAQLSSGGLTQLMRVGVPPCRCFHAPSTWN